MPRWLQATVPGATRWPATSPGSRGLARSIGSTAILREQGLVGQVLAGASGSPFIGATAPNPFEQRLRSVMDPRGRLADA